MDAEKQQLTSASIRSLSPSRRTVARGVAWSVPVIAVGAAVPAASASAAPQYALDGTFTVSRTCGPLSQVGGTLSVTQTTAGQTIKSICVLISVRAANGSSLAGLTFTGGSGNDGKWGTPTYTGTTTYMGNSYSQFRSCLGAGFIPTVTNGSTTVDPKFSFNASTLPNSDVFVYVQRVVVITLPNSTNTTTVTYIRNIAQPNYSSSQAAPVESAPGQVGD